MRRLGPILTLVLVAVLPLVADRIRAAGAERCCTDGVEVTPAYRVQVLEADGKVRFFCGVRCAEVWLARCGPAPRAILVTDCVSGAECRAEVAWFVRSLKAWEEGAPDFIRVFARRADAESHVAAYGGAILVASERPFAATTPAGREHATPAQ